MRTLLLLTCCISLCSCGLMGRTAGTAARIVTKPIGLMVHADPNVPCAIEAPQIITT